MNQITPLILEVYKDYTPPVKVNKTIQTLLEYVPPEDLAHLQSIVLTNTAALSRERKRQKTSTGAPVSRVHGLYFQAWNRQPAYIEIFVDNLLNGADRYDLRFPYLRNQMFATTLFHEIVHHVQYMSNSKLVNREAYAQKYATRLRKRFVQQHHRYLVTFYWFTKKIGLVKLIERHNGGKISKAK